MSFYESDRTVGPTGAEVDEFIDADLPEPEPPAESITGSTDGDRGDEDAD